MHDDHNLHIEALEHGDEDVAFKEELKSAQGGDANAQHNVGNFYAVGIGVDQDYKEALKWWRRAADQCIVEAQYAIGCLYSNGWGVARDQHQAATYYRKAAEHGHPSAQNNLGWLYMNGEGVPNDPYEACLWFERAAKGYQKQIDSDRDMARFKRDAVRGRWRAIWLRLLRRWLFFLGRRTLHRAAALADVGLTRQLIERGVNIEGRGKKYGGTLSWKQPEEATAR